MNDCTGMAVPVEMISVTDTFTNDILENVADSQPPAPEPSDSPPALVKILDTTFAPEQLAEKGGFPKYVVMFICVS